MKDLLSCPFCGGMASIVEDPFVAVPMYQCYCVECNAASGKSLEKEDAMAAWNRRADGDSVDDVSTTEVDL